MESVEPKTLSSARSWDFTDTESSEGTRACAERVALLYTATLGGKPLARGDPPRPRRPERRPAAFSLNRAPQPGLPPIGQQKERPFAKTSNDRGQRLSLLSRPAPQPQSDSLSDGAGSTQISNWAARQLGPLDKGAEPNKFPCDTGMPRYLFRTARWILKTVDTGDTFFNERGASVVLQLQTKKIRNLFNVPLSLSKVFMNAKSVDTGAGLYLHSLKKI